MKELTIYYSVQNGGDGSAYPRFMESQELAEWDQDNMDEGWGESCTGSITVKSESDIFCDNDIQTKEDYLINNYWEKGQKDKFIAEFFPDGLPTFTVTTENVNKTTDYLYNNVFVGDKQVARVFRKVNQSGKIFEEYLNNELINSNDNY